MTRPIRWDLIDANYDQVIKYATAIWDGTASTEAVLSRFTRSATHPAYQAMLEIGRAQRTIFAAVADHRAGAVPGLHDVQALFDLPDWAKTGPIGIRPLHGRHGNGAQAVIRAVAAASD
jgi:hypothetical protein